MAPSSTKKRKIGTENHTNRPKKFRKQQHYHSSSSSSEAEDPSDIEDKDDEFAPIDLAASDSDSPTSKSPALSDSQASNSDSESSASLTPSNTNSAVSSNQKSKRNDPAAFATSISAILNSKLSNSKRPDPVLSRSAAAQEASVSVANEKLEARAKRKIRADKKKALDWGRIKDVLMGVTVDGEVSLGGGSAESVRERERAMKKTAQRGVIQLFNAVRAAQVKAEEARELGGTRDQKQERVDAMSKKGFLDMVASGGKKGKRIEEA